MKPCFDKNPLTYKAGKYEFRKLVTQEEVRCAEKLLHETYVIEQGWRIKPDNPSGIKIKNYQNHSTHFLTDNHSDEAHWFGAIHQGEIIGCVRVLEHSDIELEKYFRLPDWLKRSSPCELNRLAICKKHRNNKVIMLMLKRVSCDFAFSISSSFYVAAEYPRRSNLYEKLGLKATGIIFKYNEDDEHEVELLHYNAKLSDRFETPLYRLTGKYLPG